ncbi:28S ribosomal protein S31, mitochondrial-like [Anneissia japonica]|uniref:28S ribosomal protein S31, mitochondrial-like n=1 Tax=Anneissia japonica TaxID=1529436 RepID=UPI001425A2F4|nr:28S ribosomal protein S31, mitochondrial-like [Anneissia japonica]
MMEKIARARTVAYYLYSHVPGSRNKIKCINGAVWYCCQANYHDDTQEDKPPNKLIATLKGLKIKKNIGQKTEKTRLNFQSMDVKTAKKPIVLDALRKAVASLPEHEKAEEELITQLEKQDAQTLAAQQTNQRPDRLHGDDGERKQSDLLQRLRSPHQPEQETNNLSSLMLELKVQQQKKGARLEETSNIRPRNGSNFKKVFVNEVQGNEVEISEVKLKSQTEPYKRQRKRSLFERYRLEIFDTSYKDEHGVVKMDEKPSIWEVEEQRTLRQLHYDSISNGFDDMAMLTEQGKVWQYPINNEQGMELEKDVGFHEHIFLETYLDNFPKKGPVRHFMELVIQGLSMNPYLTAQQKKDNIQWFQDYFKNKESVLKDTGAIEAEFSF